MPKLTWFQYVVFMVTLNLGTAISGTPTLIAKYTTRSGWMVALFMIVGVVISAAVVQLFVRTFPGKTLNQTYMHVFGKKLGWVFGLWMVLWFYLTDCLVFKEVMMFLGDAVFPDTPTFLLGPPMVILMAFVVWLDIEVIARMTEFTLPIIFAFLVTVPLAFMNVDLQLLLPLEPDSWGDLWKASIGPTFTYIIEFMVSLMLIDVVPDGKLLSRYLLLAGSIVVVIQIVSEFLITAVLGEESRELIYPVLEIVRSIRIGKYIERLDSLIVMGIITAGFFKLAMFHFGMVKSLQEISFIKSKNSAIFLSAVAIWAGGLVFFPTNSDVLEVLLKFTPSYFIVSLWVFPLIAVLVEWIRKLIAQKSGGKKKAAMKQGQEPA